jgi:hypothetical protein
LSDEAGVLTGCNRCGVGAFPDVEARLDGGLVIVVVVDEAGGGGGGNCNSGRIKSRSRKRSVICVNSNVKPRSSAYFDRKSYQRKNIIELILKTNSLPSISVLEKVLLIHGLIAHCMLHHVQELNSVHRFGYQEQIFDQILTAIEILYTEQM